MAKKKKNKKSLITLPSRDDDLCRVEAKGKGILQQNQIVAEFEALPEETQKKIEGGAFFDLLKTTQVHSLKWVTTESFDLYSSESFWSLW